jgi:cysteine desulfurase
VNPHSTAQPLYFDYHATTPVDPRALEAMLPYFTAKFGNAASRNHAFGWAASQAVDVARQQIAAAINARHIDIVLTSGATESNNLALKGVAAARRDRGRHIVTVATEHHSVLDTCAWLAREGWRVTVLGVEADGRIDVDRFREALAPDTVVVSVMAANNETGVLQPLAEAGAMARERGILVHTDASQAVGRIPFDVEALPVDLVSFTAHKLYGPKGIGALWVRKKNPDVAVEAQMHGGGHERGMRSGTLNVPGIVGFGKAAELASLELATEGPRLADLRDRLLAGLRAGIPGLHVNGSLTHRLPGNLNVSVPGIESESLAMAMDDVAVSSGSACATAKAAPSHVLTALGLDPDLACASLRFGLGRWTTADEVEYVIARTTSVITKLREAHAALGL